MTTLTGKFLVVDGVRFVQAYDEGRDSPCDSCAFRRPGSESCGIDWQVEKAQGLDCVADEAHYEVVQ